MQAEYLQALDFLDMLTEGLRFYKVCRAKTWIGHCNCGLPFPANMWRRTSGWEFYCSVDWQVMKTEGHKDSDPKQPCHQLAQ
eukprot:12605174-Prorocentrum_lima.AAC.1